MKIKLLLFLFVSFTNLNFSKGQKIKTITTKYYKFSWVKDKRKLVPEEGLYSGPYCQKDSFDIENKIRETQFFSYKNNLVYKVNYEYDNNGKLLKYAPERIFAVFKKPKINKVFYDSTTTDIKTIIEQYYDDKLESKNIYIKNKLLESFRYRDSIESFTYRGSFQFMKTIYQYNNKTGLEEKSITSFKDGHIRVIESYYDSENNEIESRWIDDGKLNFTIKNKYIGKIKTELSQFSGDEVSPKETETYDNFGNLINNSSGHSYKYKYDKFNNWIERIGGYDEITKTIRIIKYYLKNNEK